MFRNYLTVALRNLWRSKMYSFINIIGLAMGMAVSILILLFVAHEFSFDRFHVHADHTYRSLGRINYGGQNMQNISMSAQFGPAIKRANPEVSAFVRVYPSSRKVVQSDARHRFFEEQVIFADPSLLSVFSFPLLEGNPETALYRPNTVVITPAMARKYFGTTRPMGKTLVYDRQHLLEVTGVVQAPPSNSTIDFDFVVSFSSLAAIERTQNHFIKDDEIPYNVQHVGFGSYRTYLLLKPNASVSKVEKTIPRLMKQSGMMDKDTQFILEPFAGIHLANNFGDSSNSRHVYIFMGVALAILALALINYMSLTTARATKRAKEVGVRKVVGAGRRALAVQFYGESIVTILIAFLIGLTLVQVLRPLFFNLLQLQIDASFLYSPLVLALLLGLMLFCILVSGSYPALLLSQFAPAEVLKGRFSAAHQGASLRRVFTVLQFAVSTGLIVCSLVVQRQLDYMRNQNLGLHKEQVMVLLLDASTAKSYNALKNQIRQLSGVQRVAAASNPLFGGYNMFFTKTPQTQEDVAINVMSVDEDFIPALELQWKIKPTDQAGTIRPNTIIINETAVKKLKLTGNPVGQQLKLGGDDDNGSEIVGVLKDFHYSSLQQSIEAMLFSVIPDTLSSVTKYGGCLYIRLDPQVDLPGQLAAIERIYKQLQIDKPFEYSFLDQSFDALYKAEARLAKMFAAFTGFAIFIACLGLFGLIAFTAEQRTKEIGIRKVLGATVSQLVMLLSGDFLKLVVLSLLLAVPVAYYSMQRWLDGFAYRITLSWSVFAIAGAAAVTVALLTVSFQALKAARSNPVKALRTE